MMFAPRCCAGSRWADATSRHASFGALGRRTASQLLLERNADILKGLAWFCAELEDRELARALMALAISAYRKLPMIGARCPRLGNACVWARCKATLKYRAARALKVRIRISAGRSEQSRAALGQRSQA